MRKYIYTIFATITIASIIVIHSLHTSNIALKESLSQAVTNEKALLAENSSIESKRIALKLTVEQLEYFKDSLTIKMNQMRRELKVKDTNLKQMQYLLSEAQKKDTIIFRDTIFSSPSMEIDTLFGDRWYQVSLSLRYPNTIITEPKFTSEKYIIASYKKETINPPKKFFIGRWFQKKHKVIEVEVVESNPYIDNKQQRFIEIVK